jgi:AcrR family transcriptional regulator
MCPEHEVTSVTTPHDSRFQQTERLIETAFLGLCQERGSFDVTVSEVAARAHIGRSTFYLHHRSVAALSETIQERLLAMADSNLSRAVPHILANGPAGLPHYFVPIVPLMRQNRQALLLYLGPNGSAQFSHRVKQMAKTKLRRLLAAHGHMAHGDRRTEYVLEYMTAAGLGLIVHWLEDDLSMPVEELIALLGAILFSGPLTAGLGVVRRPGG